MDFCLCLINTDDCKLECGCLSDSSSELNYILANLLRSGTQRNWISVSDFWEPPVSDKLFLSINMGQQSYFTGYDFYLCEF